MSFFGGLNRKERRKFKNASQQEKIEVLATEINKKISAERNKSVATAFVDGYLFASKLLYEKYNYLTSLSNTQSDIENGLRAMFVDLKKSCDRYNELHPEPDASTKETKDTDYNNNEKIEKE